MGKNGRGFFISRRAWGGFFFGKPVPIPRFGAGGSTPATITAPVMASALTFLCPNVKMLRPDGTGTCLFLSSSAIGSTPATLGRREVRAGGGLWEISGFGNKFPGELQGNFLLLF